MPDTTSPDELDDQFRLIAESLVSPAPAPPAVDDVGLGTAVIHRHRHSHRHAGGRRRTLVPVAAAAACLLAVAGLVALARGGWSDNADVASVAPATDPGLAAPQRMILQNWFGELPEGGEPVKLPLAGLDPHGSPRFLGNGDLVVVGIHPVQEPVPEGFDERTDMTYGLAVVAPDGDVVVERDIPSSALLGVTETDAILMWADVDGPVDIVAHDLATGTERSIFPGTPPDELAMGTTALANGEVVGVRSHSVWDRILESDTPTVARSDGPSPCSLARIDLTAGTRSETDVDFACNMVLNVQASPDGSQLAVAYEPTVPLDELPEVDARVAVLDLADGEVVADQAVDGVSPAGLLGLAWEDDTTVRVAGVDLDANPRWNFDEDGLTADDLLLGEITVD